MKTLFCLLTLCVCGGLCALLLVDVINHQNFNKDLETIDIAGMVAAAIEAGEKRKSCFSCHVIYKSFFPSVIYILLLPLVHTYYLHLRDSNPFTMLSRRQRHWQPVSLKNTYAKGMELSVKSPVTSTTVENDNYYY